MLDRLRACFPPAWEESAPAAPDAWFSLTRSPSEDARRIRYELYAGDERLEQSFRWQPLLDRLDSAIRAHVARKAPERLFVHAGVVAWQGRCIVLPGRSGAGKTTLVAALVRAGATYCSDEYAVLDADGRVHPYARPMSFRHGSHRRISQCPTREFGAAQATEPHPVGLVLHTRYVPGAPWSPRVLSPGQAALALFGNTVAARERAAFAFGILSRAVHDVISLEGDRGEAEAAVPEILAHIDSTHPSPTGTGT